MFALLFLWYIAIMESKMKIRKERRALMVFVIISIGEFVRET